MREDRAEILRSLLRQAARWTTAAQQDQNPLIRMLHANYGMAYITALRQVANDAEILELTGVDAMEAEKEIAGTQDWAVQTFAAYVPELVPESKLARVAGQGGKP
jgi:hypothetical protein